MNQPFIWWGLCIGAVVLGAVAGNFVAKKHAQYLDKHYQRREGWDG